MKNYVLIAVFSAGCLVPTVFAQPQIEPRPYVRGDVGIAITEDADADFFPGAGSVTLELDPGMRFSVAGGAMFGDFFGLEMETGWLYNSIDHISGFDDADGWVTQVPFLFNARFELRNKSGLTPFVGAGAGGAIVGLNLDNARAGSVIVDGSAADAVFAWQAFGGLKFELNDNLSVGIIYKYLWTDDARWDVEDTSQDIRFAGTRSHSISAVVSYRF